MQTINFVGTTPNALVFEIVKRLKSELLEDLARTFRENEPNRYFSAKEICDRFSISKPTIHEWKKRGILQSFKLGSRVYYRMDQIESAMITQP